MCVCVCVCVCVLCVCVCVCVREEKCLREKRVACVHFTFCIIHLLQREQQAGCHLNVLCYDPAEKCAPSEAEEGKPASRAASPPEMSSNTAIHVPNPTPGSVVVTAPTPGSVVSPPKR